MHERGDVAVLVISIHALREEGDLHRGGSSQVSADFYPRPPRGGRLPEQELQDHQADISIHALREEGDFIGASTRARSRDFYPRPPRGGRPAPVLPWHGQGGGISIHALREEGDLRRSVPSLLWSRFLSTPSARRATRCSGQGGGSGCDFYPRPPRGGRHCFPLYLRTQGNISIHALREEGDLSGIGNLFSSADFYPRPPRGGRLHLVHTVQQASRFLSTPSARRATLAAWQIRSCATDFYPRPPRGGRHMRGT